MTEKKELKPRTFEALEEKPFIGGIFRYLKTNLGILIAFIVLCGALCIASENFATTANVLNVLRTVSTNAFLAIGVMMALILGGIDLTGGAMLALSGCICVKFMVAFEMPIGWAFLIAVLIGTVAGFLNGAIIAFSGIHPFIVTLAMQNICRGSAYLIAGGQPITLYGRDDFSAIGNGLTFGVIPNPVIYMVIALILLALFLNKTRIGRHIYAVGGNETAARFSGINSRIVRILVWTISGAMAAISGVVLASRMTSGQPAVGVGYETDAIAACVVGGTSMHGGVGTVGGMIIGVLIIGIISNGLNLLHVNSYWQYVVKGIIILCSVYIDIVRKRSEEKVKE